MIWIPTWDAVRGEWIYRQEPAEPVAIPPARHAASPFELPAKRNKPLPPDHKGVVAVGEAIRRMR